MVEKNKKKKTAINLIKLLEKAKEKKKRPSPLSTILYMCVKTSSFLHNECIVLFFF